MADFSRLQRPASIAFYLPQFHPIAENDRNWGPGFTEWHSVVRAQPLFAGHQQPNLPADLGFYDLRLRETREAQAELASRYSVDAFCYYHYWFSGRRLLHRPLDDLLRSGVPTAPFCLCWANEPWRANWDGRSGNVLVKQSHSSADDLAHIRWLLPVFDDTRYLRVEGRPVFLVYRAHLLPDPHRTVELWRSEAERAGIGELMLCRVESFATERDDPRALGFDASVEFQPDWRAMPRRLRGFGSLAVYDYRELAEAALTKPKPGWQRFPCVTPRWDNTPRNREGGVVITGSTPDRYRAWLASSCRDVGPGFPVFINAWNEWAEGAYLEPDATWGHAYLEAHHDAMTDTARWAGPQPHLPSRPGVHVRLRSRIARWMARQHAGGAWRRAPTAG